MSFGINGPDHIPSIQKSHHTNDGGAGNLGYFKQRKKKEEEKEEQDIFESSTKQEDKSELLLDEMDTIGSRIKNFFKNLKQGSSEEINEETDEEAIQDLTFEEKEQENPEE